MSTSTPKRKRHLPSPIPSPPRSFSPVYHIQNLHPDRSFELLQQWPSRSRPLGKSTKGNAPDLLTTIQNSLSNLDGRDKCMKIVQYAFKIMLHYRRVEATRWSPMVSHLSQARKILRLGNWIEKVKEMMTLYTDSPSPPIHKLSDHLARWFILLTALINRVADDLFCLYKLGVLGPWTGKKAERIAIYCWFLGIAADLKSNILTLSTLSQQTNTSIDGQQNHHQAKLFSAKLSCTKLSMDAIFCACDIWKSRYSPGVQAWSGFFSGCLAGYKIWCID